jgi:hypothetical protein
VKRGFDFMVVKNGDGAIRILYLIRFLRKIGALDITKMAAGSCGPHRENSVLHISLIFHKNKF